MKSEAVFYKVVGSNILLTYPLELEFVHIQEGVFIMGSDNKLDPEAEEHEKPQHNVYLPEFFISKFLITNTIYKDFTQSTNYPLPKPWGNEFPYEKGDHPVRGTSWYGAFDFCEWLSEKTNLNILLPSEAEWEKTARGSDGIIYPWGNKNPKHAYLNYNEYVGGTTPVGKYSPKGDSPYGVTDLCGNVWEWTRSIWGELGSFSDFEYPYNPYDGREKFDKTFHWMIVRGGGYKANRKYIRCAARDKENPSYDLSIGFRVVLQIDKMN